MPANLPPQYFDAEKTYRLAKTAPEKVEALEEMLAIMPKHKGTDHLRAELRRRIAKLTQASEKKLATQRASMVIEKEGAAQIAVIGLPNAGKSQLVSSITHASPTVAEYPFTTHNATSGMMEFENIKIQLIDTPPLVPQSIDPWFRHLLTRADALLVVVDLNDAPIAHVEVIGAQLEDMKIGRKKTLVIGNKLDLASARQNYVALRDKYKDQFAVTAISARDGAGLEELRQEIYKVLDIMRVYTKTPGEKPDLNDPIILERGSTLADAAADVHKDFRAKLKFARVWGSGKHAGMMVKRDHILQDGDIIELHI